MKDLDFPIFKTKTGDEKKFDLTDQKQRQEYFEYKVGPEIKKLKEFLKDNTFVAYLMGKKSSGKGTYAKMFAEVVAQDRVAHFSIGDMIRGFDSVLKYPVQKKDFVEFLQKNYRGFISLEKIMEALEGRSTKVLLPTELILALAKREIDKLGRKAIFIDGFPRDVDQVSYSLFFRDLINYRDDPDVFILIDVPTNIIDQRVKTRVICPLCNTSRSLKLLPTKNVEYDKAENKFYLICDNSACSGARMTAKEGDEHGIEPIRERLNKDELLIKQAHALQGIPNVMLRNSIPIEETENFTDDYEVTPEYSYEFNETENKVITHQKPWTVQDDEGNDVNSLMPPPVVVSMIKQLVKVLGL
jgi:adenylate kinase family enzyme